MTDILQNFQSIIQKGRRILFFTGAGVSTLSGIPDFRSANGLYNQHHYSLSPEEMLSHEFFEQHPAEFFDFYKETFDVRQYQPNIVHTTISALEKAGKCLGVITQNIDGLHTKAGSQNVIEYHGTVYKNSCPEHGALFSADDVFDCEGIPRCPHCGKIIRPEVTLYGETPYRHVDATHLVEDCDVFVVLGTTLKVYPAANFVRYLDLDTQKLVIVNREETQYDRLATLCIHEDLQTVFESL